MDARIASVAVAIVLIALVGALAAQLGGEQEAPATATTSAGGEWVTTTTTEGTTTTLTRTGPTTTSEEATTAEATGTGQAATTTTTTTMTAVTTVTTTVTKPTSTEDQESQETQEASPESPIPAPIGGEQSMAGEVIKVKVDKTVMASQGWVKVESVALALDPKAGTLQANTSLVLPDPCWNARASLEVEGQAATLTIYLGRNPAAMCVQVISETTVTAEAPASAVPGSLTIVVVINGEQHTITVDIGESPQPKPGP